MNFRDRRANRFGSDGEYILPSERQQSAPEPEEDVFALDEIEQADFIAQKMHAADSLTRKAMLRQHKWKGLDDVAKFARINPSSCLHGTLGGQQQVFQGQQLQVANWGGDDVETTPITITLSAVQQLGFSGAPKVAFTAPRFFRPFGIIQFGTRGFLVKAEVDIGLGTQFTVSGSQCTVQVALPADVRAVADPTNFNISMKLAGMLSFFPVVRTTPVTRTIFADTVAAGKTTFVAPAFAKNVIVWRNPTTEPFTLDFLDSDGFGLYTAAFAGGVNMTIPIVLSDDVVYVEYNDTGAGTANLRMIFELEF
jgi:hypothetical protein